MSDYLVHKPVEIAKVKTKRRAVLELPGWLDANYMAMPKYDGCAAVVFVKEDGTSMVSRTGEVVQSCNHIEIACLSLFPPGTVLFGEVWGGLSVPQQTVSGKFRAHYQSPELNFVLFDAVTQAEYDIGHSDRGFLDRLLWVEERVSDTSGPVYLSAYEYPGAYRGDVYRDHLLSLGGYDGMIYADPSGSWELGTGTDGQKIKNKRVLSFDLEVLGVNEGKGKYAGMAGTLTLQWDEGRTMPVGGGTVAQRKEWFSNPASILGKIIEVEAMDFTTDGMLREPRLKGIRHDKPKGDC